MTVFKDTSPCPYFRDGRESAVEYFIPGKDELLIFHRYLARGYRRTGRAFYRNVCETCRDCKPIRIRTGSFKPSRSHRRTLKKNEGVRVEVLNQPLITPGKIALYSGYVKSKHREDEDAGNITATNVLLSIHYGYPETIEMNYFLGRHLIGVGIIDAGKDSLSANYFYYDTNYLDRRLGVFSMLQEIALAKSLGKNFYYLGFYIEENQKMSYKKYFRPNEILEKGTWRDFLKVEK